jgi:hypothetical protein
VLAVLPAALAIGMTAAPANAQSVAGFAYPSASLPPLNVPGIPLLEGQTSCTPIGQVGPGIASRSARNTSTTSTIKLYSDDTCTSTALIVTLAPGGTTENIPATAPAVAYTSS